MRRHLRLKLAVLAAIVLAAAVPAVVLAAGAGSPSPADAATTPASPLAVLQAAAQQARGVQSGAGSFDLKITATPNSRAAGMVKVALAQPITLKGTVVGDAGSKAAEVQVALGSSVFSTTAGLRWLNDTGWISSNGSWYDLPPEVQEKIAAERAREKSGDATESPADHFGLDPAAWLTGLTLATETLAGHDAYRVSMGFDVARIAGDLVAVVQSPAFLQQLSGHLDAAQLDEIKQALSEAQLADVPEQAAAILRDPHADVWVDPQTDQVKQVHLTFTVVPPADAEAPVDSVAVDFTATITQLGQPVSVTAPANVQPFSELEKSLSGLQKLLDSQH